VDDSTYTSLADVAAHVTGNPLVTSELVQQRVAEIRRDMATLHELLKEPGIKQRTPEWYAAREGLITASDAAQALGCAKFGTQKQFFAKKCGYEPSEFNGNLPPLKWCTMYEPVATSAYERRFGCKVHDFGLLRHKTIGFLGASPDGINELGVMVEIKCPFRRKINGEVPMQYYYQVQGQLEVTGLHSCDYMECEFVEYASFDDMAGDSSACGCYTQDGQEHGFVLELLPPLVYPSSSAAASSSTYQYSKLGSKVPELQAELASAIVGLTPGSFRLHLFKLAKVAVTRITKDDEFVEDMVHGLSDVWAKVLHFRQDRSAYDQVCPRPSATTSARRSTAANVMNGAENAISLPAYAFLE